MGLVAVLGDMGITPSVVLGHSIGEVAAAVTAGCLTLAEGTRIVYHRSHSQAAAEGHGLMAAVGLSEADAFELLEHFQGKIELAAVNGPSTVTVAGEALAIQRLVADCEKRGVFARKLNVSVPFHCYLMNPIEAVFRESMGKLSPRQGRIPFFSSVSGSECKGSSLTTDYWWQNIRQPVQFFPAFQSLLDAGLMTFVELGPHPILKRDADEVASNRPHAAKVYPTLNRKEPDDLGISRLLQSVWTDGFPCVHIPPNGLPTVRLPQYPFDRNAYWNESVGSRELRQQPNRAEHPHISKISHSTHSANVFTADLSFDPRAEAYLSDHVVQGVVVVPGAAELETVLAAATLATKGEPTTRRSTLVLEDVEFHRAITPPEDPDSLNIKLDVYSQQGFFRIASRGHGDPGSNWVEHSRGRVNWIDGNRPFPSITPDAIQRKLKNTHLSHSLYESLALDGLKLGASFQGITAFWGNELEALSHTRLPRTLAHESTRYAFHPALLDCMLQTGAVGAMYLQSKSGLTSGGSLFLPHRVGHVELLQSPGPDYFWCYSILEDRHDDELTLSVWAIGEGGQPLAALRKLVAKRVPGSSATNRDKVFYNHAWHPVEDSPTDSRLGGGTWIVFANDNNCVVSREVIKTLSQLQSRVVVLRHGKSFQHISQHEFQLRGSEPSDIDKIRLHDEVQSIQGVVHLWMCGSGLSDVSVVEGANLGPVAMTACIQFLDAAARWNGSRPMVLLATRSEGPNSDAPIATSPSSALLTGFGRVLMSERPDLSIQIVDLSREPSVSEISQLTAMLTHRKAQSLEFSIRGDRRWMKTILPITKPKPASATLRDLASGRFSARVNRVGDLDSITWNERPTPALNPDEVEVSCLSCGLNFKDVALATGLVSGEVFAKGHTQNHIGMEVAGIVTRVGDSVTTVRIGDQVMAIAKNALANVVVADANHVVRMPSTVTCSEAAGTPMVFLTAKLALEYVAKLRSGEVALIHAAAGGVGLAAIQIVNQLGGRVVATAGSPAKVEYLKSLGVEHIFDSRREDFREKVLEVTSGRGVDVVLNSLSGHSMMQGFLCLAAFGRFVEIGKVDISENRQLALQPFAENLSYHCLDVDQWLVHKKPDVRKVLSEIVFDLESGSLRALPTTRFSIGQTIEAFRYVSEAKQIGKVVIDVPQSGTIQAVSSPLARFNSKGWYVISGGTRGYGLETAKWLVERGVRRMALFSRGGLAGQPESEQIEALRTAGAEVVVRQCDVSDLDAVVAALACLRQHGPIHGFVHAAAVLDDAPIGSLNQDRFLAVIRAKAAGAWNLHEATRMDDLKFCLLFSSISSVVGTPGQANYAAANAYLDSFACYLRARSIPAFSVNWGVLDEVGLVGRASPERRHKILNQGIQGFGRDEFFHLLEKIVDSDSPSIIAASIDWSAPRSHWLVDRFPGLKDSSSARDGKTTESSLLEQLRASPAEIREETLAKAIHAYASKLTGTTSMEEDLELRLDSMGIDSLNAVQLSLWADQVIGASVPVIQLMRGPSSLELSRLLLAQIGANLDSQVSTGQNVQSDYSASVLYCWHAKPKARLRLFCIPDFLGTAHVYSQWSQFLPETVELWTIDLFAMNPNDPKLRLPSEDILKWLAEQIRPFISQPFAFYGHSMGAWMAIEIANHLEAKYKAHAALVAAGALLEPEFLSNLTTSRPPNPEAIGDDEVFLALDRLKVPMSVASQPHVMDLLRMRFWMASRTDFKKMRLPTDIPLLVFGGESDPLATVDKDFDRYITTAIDVAKICVPGGHIFIDHDLGRETVVQAILDRLDLSREPQSAPIDYSSNRPFKEV